MHPSTPRFLDLAMQDSIYAMHHEETPLDITEELLQLSEEMGIPPVTTYQVLVLLNTSKLDEQGERLFSNSPEIRHQEHIFYETHRIIEKSLKKAIDEILSLPEELSTTTTDNFHQAISASRNLTRSLTKEDFNSLRLYYANNQNLPGPSGFYSAAFVVLDTISIPNFFYDNTPRFDLLPTNRIDTFPYYITREDIQHVTHLKQSGFEVAPSIQNCILNFLERFRNIHMGHVSRFTPQIINDNEDGTGSDYNISTREFLERRRLATINALNNLSQENE